ncbi:S-layer homology domain-containing protein [Patescibacteria group bacterium]|nr:S-layer homology domain-containing protein [Patescibacteria group bacterium]
MEISFNLRSIRRSIAGLTVLALLATMSFAGIAKADTFSDVSSSAWYYEYVEDLAGQGVISGYDDGTFGPGDNLNRAQAAKIMVLAFVGEVDSEYDAGFTDLADGAWYVDYVNTAGMYGIVAGYTDEEGELTGEFGPDDYITRAAFAKMVVNAAGLETNIDGAPHFSDVDAGAWYYEYVETAYNNSVIDGYDDATFGPGNNVNRAEASKMVINGQNPELRETEVVVDDDDCAEGYTLNDEEVCVDDNGCTDAEEWNADAEVCDELVEPESLGTLTVAMGDALAGSTVPKGATSVDVLNLTFTAGGDAVELDGLTLHRGGVGSSSDFSYVYVYDGDDRLTSGRTIASDDNEVTFGSLNLDLAAGESKTLTVVADFSSTATTGDENYLELVSADKVESNALETTGTFGIVGEIFTVSGASAGTVTIAKHGSVANPTIGEEDAEIGEFQLTASSSEDMAVKRISLTIKGTISAEDLVNFELYQGGDVVATAEAASSDDIVTFVVDGNFNCGNYNYTDDGFCLGKGNSRTFNVYADIRVTADRNDTIKVYLDESTDLKAEGLVYGFGSQVTYSAYDNGSDDGTDASHSTVQGGQFTISQNGPNSADIAINAKDVILNKMTLTSEGNVEVRQLQATLKATTGSGLVSDDDAVANFTDVKLVRLDDDGEIVETLMGPQELVLTGNDTQAAGQTVTWTDAWAMEAGESVSVAITCDVANYASLSGTTLVAELAAISGSAGVRNSDTNEYIPATDIVPASAVSGNTMTIRAASITVSLGSYPTSDTFVKGTQDVNFGSFALTVGSAMDVTISSIVIAGWLDENVDGTYTQGTDNSVDIKNVVTSVWLEDSEGNQVGTSKSFSSGDATFNSLGWTLEAGSTELLKVYGNISASAFYNSTNDIVAVDIDAAADITAEDAEGNSITPTGDNPNATTTPNVAMTISGGGTVAIAEATASPVESQIAAQQTANLLVGRYKVTATDEDFEVTKMVFAPTNSAGAGSTASGLYDNLVSLKLVYPTDATDPTTLDGEKLVSLSNTNAIFSGIGLAVPKDDSVYVELYATLTRHNLNSGGADSDDALYFTLNTGDGDGEANGDFEAIGQGSGTGYTEDELSDVTTTNVTYVYRTIPTVANDTAIGSSLVMGADQEVYRFTVSASSYEDVVVQYLTLDVSTTGITTGDAANSLTNMTSDVGATAAEVDYASGFCGGPTGGVDTATYSNAAWYIEDRSNPGTVIGTGCFDSLNGYAKFELNSSNGSANSGMIVGQGATKTLSVYADLYDADGSTANESLSLRIHNDTTHRTTTGLVALKGTNIGNLAVTGMIWSDQGGSGTHGSQTPEWLVGYKVPGMPVSYMTLS